MRLAAVRTGCLNASMRWNLVAFDLYGTLLDVNGLAERLVPFAGAGAAELLARWRKRQIERTWELNARGAYQPFDVVTADALREVAPQISDDARAQMCAAWLTLPAFSDAAALLRGWGRRGSPPMNFAAATRPASTRPTLAPTRCCPGRARSSLAATAG